MSERIEQLILDRLEKIEERVHKVERLVSIGVGGLSVINALAVIYLTLTK